MQLKESLQRSDATHPPRGKSDITQIATLGRIWLDEKRALQMEIDRLKDRLKVAEEQTTRDVGLIANLEEKLKESANSGSTKLDDADAEDLNDEMNTSRRNLLVPLMTLLISSRLQVIRLERELAASKAEAQFNKLSVDNRYINLSSSLADTQR